jgi:hypothetical protein
MFFMGVWDDFQRSLPALEDDPDVTWVGEEELEAAVHIHFTSSLSRQQSHLLTVKQYRARFAVWLNTEHTNTNLVHILSGCVGRFINGFKIFERRGLYLISLNFLVTKSFKVVFRGPKRYFFIHSPGGLGGEVRQDTQAPGYFRRLDGRGVVLDT